MKNQSNRIAGGQAHQYKNNKRCKEQGDCRFNSFPKKDAVHDVTGY